MISTVGYLIYHDLIRSDKSIFLGYEKDYEEELYLSNRRSKTEAHMFHHFLPSSDISSSVPLKRTRKKG